MLKKNPQFFCFFFVVVVISTFIYKPKEDRREEAVSWDMTKGPLPFL